MTKSRTAKSTASATTVTPSLPSLTPKLTAAEVAQRLGESLAEFAETCQLPEFPKPDASGLYDRQQIEDLVADIPADVQLALDSGVHAVPATSASLPVPEHVVPAATVTNDSPAVPRRLAQLQLAYVERPFGELGPRPPIHVSFKLSDAEQDMIQRFVAGAKLVGMTYPFKEPGKPLISRRVENHYDLYKAIFHQMIQAMTVSVEP